jgi:hypothetical protein
MPKLNPALFEPLKRIENAARRATGVLLTAPDVPATKDEMIAKEIRKSGALYKHFRPRSKAEELAGFQDELVVRM